LIQKIFKWAVLLIIVLVISLLIFLSNADPTAAYSKKHPPTSKYTATIILIDGLSQDIFNSELQKGNLPNIKKLIAKSLYFKNGIGSFPSMTGYAFYPFITGIDAVESGIYGLRWFDRNRDHGNLRNYVGRTNIHMNKDIRTDVLNAFEKHDTFYTASINTYMNRGVHHSVKTGWAYTTAKYARNSFFPLLRFIPFIGKNIAKDHFEHETLVTDLALVQLQKNPKVQWITYPSPDGQNHVHGTDDTYYRLLYHIDDQIGRICKAIKALGQEDRLIAIVTDHGLSDVDNNMDIVSLMNNRLQINLERGPSTHLYTDQLDTPLEDFMEKDGYFVINGNLSAYLYMKNPDLQGKEAWGKKLTAGELQNYTGKNIPVSIANFDGIDLVSYALDTSTIIINKNGMESRFKMVGQDSFSYSYRSEDPFSYGEKLQRDAPYSAAQILEKTYLTEYPYAPMRLFNLLTRPDGPDLVMTSLPGYDLADDYEIFVSDYKGGHGGIRSELLRVPYILYIPDQVGAEQATILSEDVGKIILEYLSR
jgi:hypothetical protein